MRLELTGVWGCEELGVEDPECGDPMRLSVVTRRDELKAVAGESYICSCAAECRFSWVGGGDPSRREGDGQSKFLLHTTSEDTLSIAWFKMEVGTAHGPMSLRVVASAL